MSTPQPGMKYDEPETGDGEALTEEDLSDAAVDCADCAEAGFNHAALVKAEQDAAPKDDRIEDEAGLMRAFASLRRATRALAQNQRMQAPVLEKYRRELQALEERCAKANAALEARAEHHRNRIEVYARTHRDELVQGKRKTRDFGIGSVSFRTTGGGYRLRRDMTSAAREAALVAWACEEERSGAVDPALPLTEQGPQVAKLERIKEYLEALVVEHKEPRTVPPGLEYVPEHEELSIKVED